MSKTEQAPYRVVESQGAIASYIFGENQSSEKIAMTAPVLQGSVGDRWKVRFVMPAGKTLKNLPKPADASVSLMELPASSFAVIRFSGTAGEESLAKNSEQLLGFIHSRQLRDIGSPVYAFYNPP